MRLLNFCNKVIEYSFYLLFFLVPLAFTGDTSELFEFNKLWATFIITIVIGFAWTTKMVIKRQFRVQKTVLDIPIALFLASEVISTFLSLDTHTSLWGYYSRFNGGLFSILAYVFLYYAFVSNLKDEEKDNETPASKQQSAFNTGFKKISIFIGGLLVFVAGALISSQVPHPADAGIPYQMLATLITVFLSFAVLMKAAPKGVIKKSLYAILSSGLLVVLWGLPSHFGYDPTCLLFRGTFDVSCWTADFQPKIRIFSTLGQPDWMGAYLAVLIPIISALFINLAKEGKVSFDKKLSFVKNDKSLITAGLFIFFALSYAALLYTQSRSAILALWIILPLLLIWYLWFYVKPVFDKKNLKLDFKFVLLIFITLGIVTFFAGEPFSQLNNFTLNGIVQNFSKPSLTKNVKAAPTPPAPQAFATELGGTDSGKIRLLVWRGAIDIWKHNPIFGSGLETFAYAYYLYRPAAHNMTSEWKFLYNKAHNEYLNYLATTGTVGILTYLSMIGTFLFFSFRYLFRKKNKLSQKDFLLVSVLAAYGTILITNFFGFSVVIINIFFYIIPAFVLILSGLINYDKAYVLSLSKKENYAIGVPQKIAVFVFGVIALFMIYTLVNYWNADRYYYYGLNYDRAQDFEKAYAFLKTAVDLRPGEPTFRDEFAYNNAVLGAAILAQNQTKTGQQQQNIQLAKQLIDNAIANTNEVTAEHPNDVVFWKTKVRVFYTLGQIDPSYFTLALAAIKKAAQLAPTDADVSYNLGVLYGQTGDAKDAVLTLKNTIRLKPDYSNAYYALAIFYHQLAIDRKGNVINKTYNQKAINELKLMEKLFGKSQQDQDAINAWSHAR